MASQDEQDVRQLFTEIGCILEDASLVALLWSADDSMDAMKRLGVLQDVQRQMLELLLQIERRLLQQ